MPDADGHDITDGLGQSCRKARDPRLRRRPDYAGATLCAAMRSCDLCESPRSRPAVRFSSRRALRSDGLIVPTSLEKDECSECGLVRSTGEFEAAAPGVNDREYRDATSRGYAFYTSSGTVPRSAALADWMMALAGEEFLAASRPFEIGADDGELLGRGAEAYRQTAERI